MADERLVKFADRMSEIMPVMMREFAKRQVNELYKGQITLPQFLMLEFLLSKGASKMTDLANFMHVTTAATTGIVERLVRDEFVQRTYDSKDRRIIKIKLTPKSVNLLKKINQQRRKMIINIFGRISEAERNDYLRILTHILEILTKGK